MTEIDYDDPILEIRYALKRNHDEARRIRQMVLEQIEAGRSQREIGRQLGVGNSTLTHWLKTAREERDGAAATRGTNHLPQRRA